jgi:cell division protein FtsI (penicillin-binding protein 3)
LTACIFVNRSPSIVNHMPEIKNGLKTARVAIVILGITFWSFLILIRLVQLQVFEYKSSAQRASDIQQVTKSILPPRGIIYDRHMDELATSMPVSTAVADPRQIKDIDAAARKLAGALHLKPLEARKLRDRIGANSQKAYMVIERRIDPNDEKRIKALAIPGVYFVEESMRVYPNRELACQALGFVNMNGDGCYGLEQQYDKDLKGKEGMFSVDVDALRRPFGVKVDKPPVQGRSLVLSIDKSVQYIADRELATGVKKAQAKSGIAIVMESDTGRILALSNYPVFNGTKYSDYDSDLWRNRAISDVFEPGSTFKVVVAAAALEAGLVRPTEMIDCQMGSITISKHVFHDHKPYGLLTFSQILEFSSNVGAAKLGLRLGEQRLYEALRNFGFGSKSGIDLPGEVVGIVRDWHNWSGLSIGAISFGQEVGVTSIQILTAINAIANGGFRVRPSLVDRIIDEKGDLVSISAPERVRLMSPQTAEAITSAFEGVILRGTGKRAALEGYRAAGKTGTAQKIVDGHYSPSKYVSSFIGFAPLPHPRITVLVQIDEPKGSHYGGDVSAPYFQKIAQETLLQLHVPPDPSLPLPKIQPLIADADSEDYLPDAVEPLKSSAESTADDRKEEIAIQLGEEGNVVLPDFRGLGKRAVLDRCVALGIRLQAKGTGLAVRQSPVPGTKVPPGTTCNVTFAKANIREQIVAADQYYEAQRPAPQSVSTRP